ncbi:unnamed protein product [Brugia pahangi]|uniref:Uncharacterized protein n=1 Tax=Brugia pahangi TaxID=6280 RepID=A0A0N4TKU2_BRUPA|nr:unnamed protein product [Brugia pahangi]
MPSQISPPQRYHENKFVNLFTYMYVKVNAGAVSKSHMDEYPSICGQRTSSSPRMILYLLFAGDACMLEKEN